MEMRGIDRVKINLFEEKCLKAEGSGEGGNIHSCWLGFESG